MRISVTTKIRLALLTTFATAAVVVACGNGDDDDTTPKSDAGVKLDATGGGGVDTGGGTGPEASTPVDAGIVDAADAADAQATPLACNGYLYCEDFEKYLDSGSIANGTKLGPWSTSVNGKNDAGQSSTMGVDSVMPFSGARALHVISPAGEGMTNLLTQTTADAGDIGAHMFGRAMVYFSDSALPGGSAPLTDASTYGLPTGVHSWLFQGYGPSPVLKDTVSANIIVGSPTVQINYQPGANAGYGESGKGAFKDAGTVSLGAWHCLQWEYDGSGYDGSDKSQANIINVWMDSVLNVAIDPSYEDAAIKLATDWNQLSFGFTHYQTLANPVEVYLDDFAVNTTTVPCPSVSP